jgi:hypothetical protein
MSTVTATSVWPVGSAGPTINGVDTLVIDLRGQNQSERELEALQDLSRWCVREATARTSRADPLAIVVRHHRSGSGRTSDTLFGELALNAVRGFFRQLRYDRSWLSTPLSFVDAGNSSDEEITQLVTALASGPARVEVDKSSGETVAANWKYKEGL